MKRCIVIIEDDEAVRTVFEIALSGVEQCSTLSFASGEEAIATLLNFTEEVCGVITDIHLPGMNGMDFVRVFKNVPGWGSIPIVAISGDPSPHLGHSAIQSGADLFLKKPCSPAELRENLERLIYAKAVGAPFKKIANEASAASDGADANAAKPDPV